MMRERRGLMRGLFKQSGCIFQYCPGLKDRATARAAEQRVNNKI